MQEIIKAAALLENVTATFSSQPSSGAGKNTTTTL
jgi:hypothetical protein